MYKAWNKHNAKTSQKQRLTLNVFFKNKYLELNDKETSDAGHVSCYMLLYASEAAHLLAYAKKMSLQVMEYVDY